MKALSLHAPWATAIAAGIKTVEFRSWPTKYRGDLLICSGAKKEALWEDVFVTGHCLCLANLIDCRPFTKKDLKKALLNKMPDNKGYAWILNNIRPVKPFPVKGQQRLFNVFPTNISLIDLSGDDLHAYWVNLGLACPIVEED